MNFSYIWKLAVTELNDFSGLETAMEEQVRQAPLARSRDQIFDDLPEVIFVGVFFAGSLNRIEVARLRYGHLWPGIGAKRIKDCSVQTGFQVAQRCFQGSEGE